MDVDCEATERVFQQQAEPSPVAIVQEAASAAAAAAAAAAEAAKAAAVAVSSLPVQRVAVPLEQPLRQVFPRFPAWNVWMQHLGTVPGQRRS